MAEVLHHDNHGHDEHHHHDDTDITVFGFWTYLMSDLIIFGTLFIAFAVLSSHVPMGTPSAKELFGESLGFVLTETFALLISSVTFGFAVLAAVGWLATGSGRGLCHGPLYTTKRVSS